VVPEDRIATFDQDGTLWAEHPLYAQAAFALDRLRKLAAIHPEWQTEPPFKAVLDGQSDALARLTEADWARILAVTHSGMTTDEFRGIVTDWLAVARDPRWHQPYTSLVYAPMLELMAYLRASGFKTYIATGGGQDFVRTYAERAYGVPPEQVIGSTIATKYEHRKDAPVLVREPKVSFVDDRDGKVVGIDLFLGKRPSAAFGNSDGDRAMLEWTTSRPGAHFGMIVLHDDAAREYAYGPAADLPVTKVGALSQEVLDEGKAKGWLVVSMKNDWRRVFAFEP
jgi:phosphoserine phosphatase